MHFMDSEVFKSFCLKLNVNISCRHVAKKTCARVSLTVMNLYWRGLNQIVSTDTKWIRSEAFWLTISYWYKIHIHNKNWRKLKVIFSQKNYVVIFRRIGACNSIYEACQVAVIVIVWRVTFSVSVSTTKQFFFHE